MTRSTYLNIRTNDAFTKILEKHTVTIVKACASWCKPCQKIKPLVQKIVENINDKIAFVPINDSSNLKIEREVRSVLWQQLALGEHSPAPVDSLIYFVFTNDFINRKKNQDLNLKRRNVIFREVKNDSITVNVSWNPNMENDLAGYKIYYGESRRNYTSSMDVGIVTNKILSLSAHKTYYVAVTAYDSALNESFYSEEVVFRFDGGNSISNLSKNSPGAANSIYENQVQPTQPNEFALAQNFPNPFNPTTNIRFKLTNSVRVKLRIYNMMGQLVRILINDDLKTAGEYTVQWDGKEDSGQNVASGVYVYRIQAGKFVRTRKMLLLR